METFADESFWSCGYEFMLGGEMCEVFNAPFIGKGFVINAKALSGVIWDF